MKKTLFLNKMSDIIVIIDESSSMNVMGDEPVDAVNAIINGQKENKENNSTFTLVKFNDKVTNVIENELIHSVKSFHKKDYNPCNMTALHDSICKTINAKLESKNPYNVILTIITDGKENCSQSFTLQDTQKLVKLVESKYSWKVIFIGANMNTLEEGTKINIDSNRCSSFDQTNKGDLVKLCRKTSDSIIDFCRRISTGEDVDLCIDRHPYQSPLLMNKNLYRNLTGIPSIYI